MTGNYRGTFHSYTNIEAFNSQRLRVLSIANGQAIRIQLGNHPQAQRRPKVGLNTLTKVGAVDAYLLDQFENFSLDPDEHYSYDSSSRISKFIYFIYLHSA